MKIRGLFRIIFTCALTAAVMFTVSVREVHYLFAHHCTEQERCENHLHGKDTHADCTVCKSDILFFTDEIFRPTIVEPHRFAKDISTGHPSFIPSSRSFSNPLRGPPVMV